MIYLASPYSHADPAVREERFRAASRYAAVLLRRGEFVFSPIAHTHPIATYADEPLPDGWAFWGRFDTPFLAMASEVRVLRLDGWLSSEGVHAEVELANGLNIPVVYADPVPAEAETGARRG